MHKSKSNWYKRYFQKVKLIIKITIYSMKTVFSLKAYSCNVLLDAVLTEKCTL